MKVPKFSLAGEASVAVLHLRHKKSDHLTKTFTWIDHPGILAATQGCVFFFLVLCFYLLIGQQYPPLIY